FLCHDKACENVFHKQLLNEEHDYLLQALHDSSMQLKKNPGWNTCCKNLQAETPGNGSLRINVEYG
ncbi:hypothetical protein SK128_000788, partial [Halocaridina rubra]